jgi:hypothetical protein
MVKRNTNSCLLEGNELRICYEYSNGEKEYEPMLIGRQRITNLLRIFEWWYERISLSAERQGICFGITNVRDILGK